MNAITFDTLVFTRRLRDAGFNEQQAETVVRVLSDAQDNLVTREHFDNEVKLIRSDVADEFKLLRWMLALVIAAEAAPLLSKII